MLISVGKLKSLIKEAIYEGPKDREDFRSDYGTGAPDEDWVKKFPDDGGPELEGNPISSIDLEDKIDQFMEESISFWADLRRGKKEQAVDGIVSEIMSELEPAIKEKDLVNLVLKVAKERFGKSIDYNHEIPWHQKRSSEDDWEQHLSPEEEKKSEESNALYKQAEDLIAKEDFFTARKILNQIISGNMPHAHYAQQLKTQLQDLERKKRGFG